MSFWTHVNGKASAYRRKSGGYVPLHGTLKYSSSQPACRLWTAYYMQHREHSEVANGDQTTNALQKGFSDTVNNLFSSSIAPQHLISNGYKLFNQLKSNLRNS